LPQRHASGDGGEQRENEAVGLDETRHGERAARR
jgi:hypothetical protein